MYRKISNQERNRRYKLSPKQGLHASVPRELAEWVRAFAKSHGVSMSAMIEVALRIMMKEIWPPHKK